jgi:hypothetical protein
MQALGLGKAEAESLLAAHGGRLAEALRARVHFI